jgi:hypothetical protein
VPDPGLCVRAAQGNVHKMCKSSLFHEVTPP